MNLSVLASAIFQHLLMSSMLVMLYTTCYYCMSLLVTLLRPCQPYSREDKTQRFGPDVALQGKREASTSLWPGQGNGSEGNSLWMHC